MPIDTKVMEVAHHPYRDWLSANKLTIWSISQALKPIRSFVTDELHITGMDNLMEDRQMIPGPFLFLPGHVSWYDFVTYFKVWQSLPIPVKVKAAAKEEFHNLDYLVSEAPKPLKLPLKVISAVPGMHYLYQSFWNQFTFPVYRTSLSEEVNTDTLAQQKAHNHSQLNAVRSLLKKRYSLGIFPEATTKSSGAYPPLRIGGTYESCHWFDGSHTVLKMVVVGNTYDFLAGRKNMFGKQKHLAFFTIGKPFTYEPLPREYGMTIEDWKKADMAKLAEEVLEEMVNLNTFTTSQIGSFYLMDAHQKGKTRFSMQQMKTDMHIAFQALDFRSDGPPIYKDWNEEHMDVFCATLFERGYLKGTAKHAEIDDNVLLKQPDNLKRYKKQNPLLHSFNRLAHVAKHRDRIGDLLGTAFQTDLLEKYELPPNGRQ